MSLDQRATPDNSSEPDWSSECFACRHPYFHHRSPEGSCFASRESKVFTAHHGDARCWCPGFCNDAESGVETALAHADVPFLRSMGDAALKTDHLELVERIIPRVARLCGSDSDVRWMEATREILAERRSKRPIKANQVSKCPPPPTVLGGGSWIPSQPKPQVPTDFPSDYPQSLRIRTGVILADTAREFQDRWTLEQLCRKIVSNLTDLLCESVREGTLMDHAAPERLKKLLHYVCVSNSKYDDECFRAETAAINSDEWHAMLKRLAVCEDSEPHKLQLADGASKETATRARIDAFIEKLRDAGHPITRTDIWRVAGYQDATEFERFQREDDRTTSGSKARFNRVLDMSPEVFIEKRKKQTFR